jgi:hypothetical protein
MSALPQEADMLSVGRDVRLSAIGGHLLLDLFEVVQLPTFVEVSLLRPVQTEICEPAFRAVAKVQRGIGAKQGFTWR